MSLFKKKKKLFGNQIADNCEYCTHNVGSADKTHCSLQLTLENDSCKKFVYNPLMRMPKAPLLLNKKNYRAEDFNL